jgi:hypothetical protein
MARGNGILCVEIRVDEVDQHGNRKHKKLISNEDYEVPTDSISMHQYDGLAIKLAQAMYEWGEEYAKSKNDG